MWIITLLRAQQKSLATLAVMYVISMAVLLAMAVQPYVKVSTLTRDAIVIAKGHFYYGLLSNMGILLWCAAAAVCLFCTLLLHAFKQRQAILFFLSAGLLTAALLMDDFFLLHEEVFPKYLGINEHAVVSFYPIAILAFLFFFRNTILASNYLVLLSALGFLGLSFMTDAVAGKNIRELECLVEDGFKFLGIVGWSYYLISTCLSTLKAQASQHVVLMQEELLREVEVAKFS